MSQVAEKIDGHRIVEQIRKEAAAGIDPHHPLWTGLEEGKFDKDQLKLWIKQEYHVRNYIIKTLYYTMANSLLLTDPPLYDEEIRILILKSVLQEEGEVNFGVGDKVSHPSLLVQFGEALGMTKAEMHAAPILGCTRAWLDEFIQRCNNSLVEALAGNNMTAELFNTIVFPRVINGLKNRYGFDHHALEFFYEHSDPEVEGAHVEMGADLLARRIKTEADAVKARWAAKFTLIAIQDFYRAIYEHMMAVERK